ncbi:MAG: tetratricopeptide repeat protein [bacterium]
MLKLFKISTKYILLIFFTFYILIFPEASQLRASELDQKVQQEIYKTNKIFELYYSKNFEECMKYCYSIITQDIDNTTAYIFYLASSFQLDKLQETINNIDSTYISFVQRYNATNKDQVIETSKDYHYLTALVGFSNIFLYFSTNNGGAYLDEAINTFRKSLFFPVTLACIYSGLGIAYYEKKLNERAISMLNRAFNVKSYDPIALEYFGKIQNSLGNYNQTISKLKNYIDIKYPDMIYQLAYAYEKVNEIDKAVETYDLAYKYDPNLLGQGFISLVRMGDIFLYKKNDKQKAISCYEEILKILPDSLVAKSKIEEAQNYDPNKKQESNEKKKKKRK